MSEVVREYRAMGGVRGTTQSDRASVDSHNHWRVVPWRADHPRACVPHGAEFRVGD